MHRIFMILSAILVLLFLSNGENAIGPAPGMAQADGTLLLNEISPWPSDGVVWVEIINPGDTPVGLDGWRVQFMSGFSYTFPSGSDEIAAGALHLLNITGGNPLNADGDGCVLSSPDGPVDAITWASPADELTLPLSSGPPLKPPWGVLHGDDIYQADDVLIRIPDTWPPSNEHWRGSQYWAYRSADSATPGEHNPSPGPTTFTPGNGTRFASDFELAVIGHEWSRVTFQVATDESFENVVLEETVDGSRMPVSDLPAGDYFWRVRSESDRRWSATHTFSVLPYDIDELLAAENRNSDAAVSTRRLASAKGGGGEGVPDEFPVFPDEELVAHRILGCPHYIQRKDTDMVCMDGCPMEGDDSWEDPHPETLEHGDMYCSRACLSMIAGLSGCMLSQDRITYFIFEEAGSACLEGPESGHLGDPFGDLGHDLGTWPSSTNYALEWIYGQPHGTAGNIVYSENAFDDGDPSDMDTVREFIDDGRPLIRHSNTHSTVVDGYVIVRSLATDEETATLHVLDPAHETESEWIEFICGSIIGFSAPPTTGAPMRCDEAEVSADSDGDMLVDFDEINRLGTDPNNSDTDGDGLDDMVDMYEYLFTEDGMYDLRERDYDGDGEPKETDPDNDRPANDGVIDGCEDVDLNGFFNPDGSESNNFDFDDEFSVLSRYCYDGSIRIESHITGGIFGTYGGSLTVNEFLLVEADRPMTLTDYVYDHTWELTSTPMSISAAGITVTSSASGGGETLASIEIDVDEDGHYIMTTDCDPRVVTYTITTHSPEGTRTTSEDFHLAIADHHYGYVSPLAPAEAWAMMEEAGPPNIFEGEVIVDPDGGTRIAGEDTYTLPEGVGMSGTCTRSWEIWIDR